MLVSLSFFWGYRFKSLDLHNFLVYCIIGVRIVIFDFRVVCRSVYLILLSSTEGFTQKCYLHSKVYTLIPTPLCQWHLVCKSVNKVSYFCEIVFVQHPWGGGQE